VPIHPIVSCSSFLKTELCMSPLIQEGLVVSVVMSPLIYEDMFRRLRLLAIMA